MSNAEQRSDSELLLAARTCSESFGVFYERHVASVLAFFRRRVPGPEEAFDLTAETFAAALASVPRYEPGPELPRAWLFAIARHKLSEALRHSRVQDEARRALAMEPIQLDDKAIEILETTARAGAVELLETLPPEQRDAIKAHHLEERGYADIASELRSSESVIRKRVSRGLTAVQAQLVAHPQAGHPAPHRRKPDTHRATAHPEDTDPAATWLGRVAEPLPAVPASPTDGMAAAERDPRADADAIRSAVPRRGRPNLRNQTAPAIDGPQPATLHAVGGIGENAGAADIDQPGRGGAVLGSGRERSSFRGRCCRSSSTARFSEGHRSRPSLLPGMMRLLRA